MRIGDTIPVEPGFRDGRPIYWWRVEWDEEYFANVEACTADEAVEKAIVMLHSKTPPKLVSIIKEWVVVG